MQDLYHRRTGNFIRNLYQLASGTWVLDIEMCGRGIVGRKGKERNIEEKIDYSKEGKYDDNGFTKYRI